MFSKSTLFKSLSGSRPEMPRRFDQVREAEQASETIDRGSAQVPISRIVGTVGRYRDFDGRFRARNRGGEARFQKILAAMRNGTPLPPVSLYQIKDDFFILDGHHRVAAARELGREIISARIVELLPTKQTLENQLYLEKIKFRDRAGLLTSINLTELDQYHHLELQIREHQAWLSEKNNSDITYKQAAADWYQTIYHPLATIIGSSNLAAAFPGRTVDDLYLYISTHQWNDSRPRQYGIGIDKLIPRDMEAFRKKMADLKNSEYPEMKQELTFFVLLNVDGRQERKIIDRLMQLEPVRELHSVHGTIDIILKVVLQRELMSSDAELISQFTHGNVRTLKGVLSTQTLIPGLSRFKEVPYCLPGK
jgi:uncharacterized ParB-like nuclease family protein